MYEIKRNWKINKRKRRIEEKMEKLNHTEGENSEIKKYVRKMEEGNTHTAMENKKQKPIENFNRKKIQGLKRGTRYLIKRNNKIC